MKILLQKGCNSIYRNRLTASGFGVSGETGDTLAVTNMVDGYSGCSKCIGSARIPYARIGTGLVSSFTILDDLAVWIFTTLRNWK